MQYVRSAEPNAVSGHPCSRNDVSASHCTTRLAKEPGTPAGVRTFAWNAPPENFVSIGLPPLGRPHPRLRRTLGRTMSATSLRLLLRDPIRFTWRYALGWRQPEEADEPLTLDALAFGNLVHAVLQTAVSKLESDGGFGNATADAIGKAVEWAVGVVAGRWETAQPVPPPIIWRKALGSIGAVATAALTHPLGALPDQRTWTEVPFGTGDAEGRNDLPWNPACPVEIPGTGILIQGHIDRLDRSGDGRRARVIDYKTGRLDQKKMNETVVDGGRELQRCLYAFAVRTLLAGGGELGVETALLYPRAEQGEQAYFGMNELDHALDVLAKAIAIARTNLENGLALPGKDAESDYNDFAFAFPANAGYLVRKRVYADALLGDAIKIWEAA
jgi:hypothetical protein